MKPKIFFGLGLALILAAGCATPRVSKNVFRPDKLAAMDAAIETAIASNQCPGGVLWLEHEGVAYHKAYGYRALVPERETMTEDTVFDMASLTKVMATTPAVMLLVQRGQVKLDAPVRTYLPEFAGEGRDLVTVRELMTHTSGLPPDLELRTDWSGYETAIKKACAETLQSKPGTVFKYSDINFILLGEIVQRVSKLPLPVFVQREIYGPLKMTDTGFLPLGGSDASSLAGGGGTHAASQKSGHGSVWQPGATGASPPRCKLSRIAPTEVVDGKPWRGVVHDPTARRMGGVAGHAGLFSTASDVARYARMMLNLGELDGVRIFKPETVKLMTSVQTPSDMAAKRGLGWDIDTAYSGPRGELFPIGSYGHTGWTGGSLWIDPFSKTFVIFLSNRNHPTEAGNVLPLRRKLGTLAAESLANIDFANARHAVKEQTNSVAPRK